MFKKNKIFKIIDTLYNKKISSKGLSLFRIFFALNFFFEINRIYRYRQLYFDPIPFLEKSSLDYSIPLTIWMGILLLLVFGLFTRFASIVNYIFVVIFISSMKNFEYHMDYTYTGVSFLMMLLPLSNSFSLDNLLKKYKYSNTRYQYIPKKTVSVLYYYLPLFIGVGFVYLDSLFYKFTNVVWLNGIGMWLPASLPQITILNDQWLLNQEYLIKFLGYFTVFFETIFIFTFFVKKLRLPIFIIGVGLHIGILLEFPIPYFALGVISIYLLMVPVTFWDYLFKSIKATIPSLTFFYDDECPLCVRTKITIKHFDVFNKVEFKSVQRFGFQSKEFEGVSEDELLDNIYSIDKKGNMYSGVKTYKKVFSVIPVFYPLAFVLLLPGVTYLANKIYKIIANNRNVERCTEDNCGYVPPVLVQDFDDIKLLNDYTIKRLRIAGLQSLIILLIILQINVTLFSYVKRGINKLPETISANFLKKTFEEVERFNGPLRKFSVGFLGFTRHGVFLDGHYRGYDKVFNVSYKGNLLPMFDENGMPDKYLLGGTWANFGFRVNMPNSLKNEKKLKKGLVRFVAFWAKKNNINLSKTEFKIVMKRVRAPFKWEKDLLKNNLETPWVEVGKLKWKNSSASVKIDAL